MVGEKKKGERKEKWGMENDFLINPKNLNFDRLRFFSIDHLTT
jgi:hypothetical protein